MISTGLMNLQSNQGNKGPMTNPLMPVPSTKKSIERMYSVLNSHTYLDQMAEEHLSYGLNPHERQRIIEEYIKDQDYEQEEMEMGEEDSSEDSENLGDDSVPGNAEIKHAAYMEAAEVSSEEQLPRTDGVFANDFDYLENQSSFEVDEQDMDWEDRAEHGVFPIFVGR